MESSPPPLDTAPPDELPEAPPDEQPADFWRNPRYDPVKVALVYLLLMLPIALIFHKPNDGLETDFFGSYAPQARGLLVNGVLPIEEYRGPIYPLALAGAKLLCGDFFRAGVILSVVSAAALLGVLFLTVTQLWNRRLALWAVVIAALNPVFVRCSYEAGTDMLFAALCFATLFFVLNDQGLRSGIWAAAAYLTRYNGAALLLPSLFTRKRFWILGTFAVLILPWGLRCWKEKGNFFYNKNYLNLAYNVYGEGRPWDNFWNDPNVHKQFTSFRAVVAHDPAAFITKMLTNVGRNLFNDSRQIMGIFQTILVAVGLLFLRPDRKRLLFFLFALWMFVINLFAFYSERFSLFLVPFYAVLAVIGSERLWEFARNTVLAHSHVGTFAKRFWNSVVAQHILISALVVFTAVNCVRYNVPQIGSDLVYVPAVAAQIAPHMTAGTVCARKPHIVWFLNEQFRLFPTFSHVPIPTHDLIATLRRDKVNYLYLSVLEYYLRPETRPLFDPKNMPLDFMPIYFQRKPPVVVYQINPISNPFR
jgi:hypothetical protein